MSHAPSRSLEARHRAIRQRMAERSLTALVVTALPNVLYLTNFTGSSGVVLLTADQLFFITDFRYVAAMSDMRGTAHECPGLELAVVSSSYDDTLAELIGRTSTGGRVGFEAAHLPVSRHLWLLKALGAGPGVPELVPTEGLVEHARVRKDPYELEVLREAGRRIAEVARTVHDEVQRGRRETEVALAIDVRLRQAGFERTAFETIVAGGPNAALPHARPGERTLGEGDLVVLDFGGVYDSYCVDVTRTVSIGRASDRARKVYDAVRLAHDSAIARVRPGVSRFDIDAAARDTLVAEGLGEAFGHGTGHGLGIEVHEEPRVTRRRADPNEGAQGHADDLVAPGMVFTIEPGAYIPGWSGVRIEDDVLVTGDGVEVLTNAPTALVEV